ncbi:LacI family DNA-binding transcriptional regulator [Saccharothrix coeruleofusca]|uniref:LacI family transcriptional regulator n=1 Tax=Saccharothrix coeruleofusca TaxID=33919 RepID=A0A918AKA9_9PSEU|nr:LacI family DNA-binding transcriptional regulator [Saccharothrix coeruleofusca]MBP2338252.1 DNA-binding LacI/PurR family transcriptional regulator [Saccharothrix coeruleofusca]GGP49691.1 LacI family transcriptional regulator [Saccharothrix coeruleofusca]
MSVQSHPGARPTLEDVAARAGVSRATASRVLNDSPRVSPEAQEAVTAAVTALGYQPNRAARALVTRRTGAVAVLFSEPEPKIFDDPHFAWLIRAAARALADADVQMVLMLVHSPRDQARAERFLAGGHVDGALMFAPHKGDRLPAIARKLPLPVVYAGRPWGPLRGLHLVDHDNQGGGALATEHLISLGRKRIGTVTGPLDELSAIDRLAGWRAATGADDETTALLAEEGGFSREGGKRAMAALLERAPDLDAVFVASDLMAAGALDALREAGKRVPDDVAVVGFDDHPMIAPHTVPPLTSVRQDTGDQVRHMVEHLLRLLRDEPVRARREVLPTVLVRRESA